MRKITAWDEATLLYFNCAALVATGFGLSQDILFYKSNLADILAVLFFPSLVLALPLAIPLLLIRRRTAQGLALAGFTILQTGFVLILIDRIFLFRSLYVFAGTALTAVIVLGIISFKSDQKEIVLSKMLLLSRLTCAGLLLFTAFWGGRSLFQGEPASRGKNIVMVVVDGLGAHASDHLVKNSLSFTGMRTNKAWTAGYFKTLYSGNKRDLPGGKNLFQLLQSKDIRTMWMTFHNDGVPDAFHFPYNGLRASFITQFYSWLPKRLGSDYNVFFYRRPGYSGKSMGSRQKWLKHQLNRGFKSKPLLDDFVVDEIQYLRKGKRPFFLLVHVNVTPLESPDPGLWERRAENDAETRAWKEIWDADYVYTSKHSQFIEQWKTEYRESIKKRNKRLEALYAAFQERQWDKDTLLFITADHGKMFSNGKAWYGFHPDEEVARVPFLVLGDNLQGTDTRLSETIDISQTILSNFSIDEKLSPEAYNLLAPAKTKFTTTLTRASKIRAEHFLNVYDGEQKFTFNLASDKELDLSGAHFDIRKIVATYGFK